MKRLLPPFRAVRLSLVSILLLATLSFATAASATVMRYADIPSLIDISDVIVQGTVVNETFLTEPDTGHTVTRTEIKVSRTFLGPAKEKLVFQQWGGIAEGKTSGVPGDARFEKGEEVILFLHSADKAPGLFLSALGQSKYKILRDANGVHVWRTLDDMSFLAEGTAPTRLEHRPDEKLGYDSFVAELEATIAAVKETK